MTVLPRVLNDIIWDMAFNEDFRVGWNELEMLNEFRERVPPCLCPCETMHRATQMFVLNPFRRGTPYRPLRTVFFMPWGHMRYWIAKYTPVDVVRQHMRTYPRVFMRHATYNEISSWNRVLKYLLRIPLDVTLAAPHQTKYRAAIRQIQAARPLSRACSLYPWPGSRASVPSQF